MPKFSLKTAFGLAALVATVVALIMAWPIGVVPLLGAGVVAAILAVAF